MYTWDAQGNLASRAGQAFQFDVGNRLRGVVGSEAAYAYDDAGRRVSQTSSGGSITSFYDSTGKLVWQRDRDGNTHDDLYLGGKLIAIRDFDSTGTNTGTRYQHTDALGSVIAQTNASGSTIPGSAAIYDAWGGVHGVAMQDGPGYTGHVEDSATGLVYMQQRYYDPNVGRFLSMDPVQADGGSGGNLDRYWYANDNPEKNVDPDGRIGMDCGFSGCVPDVARWNRDQEQRRQKKQDATKKKDEKQKSKPVTLATITVTATAVAGRAAPELPSIPWSTIGTVGRRILLAVPALIFNPYTITFAAGMAIPGNMAASDCGDGRCGTDSEGQPDEKDLTKLKEGDGNRAAVEAGYADAHDAKAGRGGGHVDIYRDKTTGVKWLWNGVRGGEKEKL